MLTLQPTRDLECSPHLAETLAHCHECEEVVMDELCKDCWRCKTCCECKPGE